MVNSISDKSAASIKKNLKNLVLLAGLLAGSLTPQAAAEHLSDYNIPRKGIVLPNKFNHDQPFEYTRDHLRRPRETQPKKIW